MSKYTISLYGKRGAVYSAPIVVLPTTEEGKKKEVIEAFRLASNILAKEADALERFHAKAA